MKIFIFSLLFISQFSFSDERDTYFDYSSLNQTKEHREIIREISKNAVQKLNEAKSTDEKILIRIQQMRDIQQKIFPNKTYLLSEVKPIQYFKNILTTSGMPEATKRTILNKLNVMANRIWNFSDEQIIFAYSTLHLIKAKEISLDETRSKLSKGLEFALVQFLGIPSDIILALDIISGGIDYYHLNNKNEEVIDAFRDYSGELEYDIFDREPTHTDTLIHQIETVHN